MRDLTEQSDLSALTDEELDVFYAAEEAQVDAMSEEEQELWGMWERCWHCPRKLDSVEQSAAGVCTVCQALGRTFPDRPRLTPEDAYQSLLSVIVRAHPEVAGRLAEMPPTFAAFKAMLDTESQGADEESE